MIRLTLLLCAGLYLSLMVLGEDHGQKRYGLTLADKLKPAQASETPAPDLVGVVFVPAQPVMKPVTKAPVVVDSAVLVSATPVEALPDPEIPGGALFSVTANRVNVRQGPGTGYDVVGGLTHGEQVLVLIEEDAVTGWSKVRIEGDGIDGYVATRLLKPVD
jgi:hypothetical protein